MTRAPVPSPAHRSSLSAGAPEAMLFDPSSHEPLTGIAWDEWRARAAIATIVADAENAFSGEALWPSHPDDEEDGPLTTLYIGAAGVIWALPWLEAWSASAEPLWTEWRDEVWQQDLYGSQSHYLGPAHGFAGNVFALARGGMLTPARRAELEARATAVLGNHAMRSEGLAQWPPALERPRKLQPIRTQWCHGAPGIVTSCAKLAMNDGQFTALLVAGGELTWQAGPLRKGANLCHGTAGNGYAFLKLFERTGNEVWLTRARAFAMHAIDHVESQRARHGHGHHTLWTGDLGTALYLNSCLNVTAGLPTLDYL